MRSKLRTSLSCRRANPPSSTLLGSRADRRNANVRTLAWLLALALYVGCGREDDAHAHLIQIDTVEQRWGDSGQLLVRGEGMPQGMRGEARLVGTLFAPGREARAIDARLPCRALGKTEVLVELEAVLQPEGVDARGSAPEQPGGVVLEGPFSGRVELRFGTHDAGRVVGRLDNILVRLGRPPSLEQQFAERKRTQAFQRSLGVRALLLSDDGLSVAELEPEGPAARAGVFVGDIVTRLMDRPLQLPRDFVAVGDVSDVQLDLLRGPNRTPQRRHILIAKANPAGDPTLLGLGLTLGASLGLWLCMALPREKLWAPRRREYWLALCLIGSLTWLSHLLLAAAPAALSVLGRAALAGMLCGAFAMCCRRLLRPTSRTTRDPALAPLV
jgi:hypothetical protein